MGMLRQWEEVEFPGSSENSGMEVGSLGRDADTVDTAVSRKMVRTESMEGVDVLNLSSCPQSAACDSRWSISTET